MEWMTRPPELITALTNLLNTLVALCFLLPRLRGLRTRPQGQRLWWWMVCALAGSSLVGTVVHLVRWSYGARMALWALLGPMMCLSSGLMLLCAAAEEGEERLRRARRPVRRGTLALCACAVGAALLGKPLAPTIIAAAVSLIYAGWVFFRRARSDRACRLFAAGVAVNVPGGLCAMLRTLRFRLIWEMDYNSLFHLAMLAGLLLFWRGCVLRERAVPAEE